MIGTIAMAVGSVVAKQAATIALNKTVTWILNRKDPSAPPSQIPADQTTVDDVVRSMDLILEWSDD